jgi:hypothetical protein
MMNWQIVAPELKSNKLRSKEQAYRQAFNDLFSYKEPVTDQYWWAILSERRINGPGFQKELDRIITAVDRILDKPHFEYKGYFGCADFEGNKLYVRILHLEENVSALCNDVRRAEYTFKELVRDYTANRRE